MFLTDKAAKEKIAGLETRITDLEADAISRDEALTTAQTDLATATESLSTITAERDTANASLATANATIATHVATIAAQPTEAQIQDRIETAAQAKVASLGGPPVTAGGEEKDGKPDLSGLTGFAKVAAAFAAKK